MSVFKNIPECPGDPIFGVAAKFMASKLNPKEVLGVGVYRDEQGKPHVFDAVRKAETKILHKFNKEYMPMTGDPNFVKAARELLWGPVLNQVGDRIASSQTIAGTGAVYTAAMLVKKQLHVPEVLVSDPTWPNYYALFGEMGFKMNHYRYAKDCKLNFSGMIEDLKNAPEGCLVVFQACAHNPTGIDPNAEQWKEIMQVVNQKKHIPLFDFAYMGYASGNTDKDAEFIRNLATTGTNFFVAFSFSKCMGLYGERVGCLHAVTSSPQEAKCVNSQFGRISRFTFSVCPQNGSHIASTVITDPEIRKLWEKELNDVTKRVIDIRNKLVDKLETKTKMSWDFIRQQKGMFAFTGLSKTECDILADKEGLFLPDNGRISIPALNNRNVDFCAQAIANVVALRNE